MSRAIVFKPMPWLSILTIICMLILIALGVWQYQRLQWKTALLAEVELAVTAPPLTSLSELRDAIAQGDAVDFRRIEIDATRIEGAQTKLVFYPQQGGIYWRGFTPVTEVNASGSSATIYAAMDIVEDKNRDAYQARPVDKIIGYVRFAHALGAIESRVKSKANAEKNRYFKFNQTQDWDKGLLRTSDFFDDYYLEHVIGATRADRLPVKRPKIRNNHFDYMLTWFSFAIILLIIYVILHVKAKRLTWRGAEQSGPTS